MKRKRFTEEQIISILKENEAGISVPDLALRHGFAEGMFYTRRSKFGGMDVSDAKKLVELDFFIAVIHHQLARPATYFQ